MKEIGGYIELDTYSLPMLHGSAEALNCGRNALAYLFHSRQIRKIWLPDLICDSVTGVCSRERVPFCFYRVGFDFLPQEEIDLKEGEWFYFVNYYSQFDNDTIKQYVAKYSRVIVDNAQSYFQLPLLGVDTIYTCRKYFGVPDGAFLYTNQKLSVGFPLDESFERMHFLLGRFERDASDFYKEYVANNDLFQNEPIKRMSKLTKNLLHALDYSEIERRRMSNFSLLNDAFCSINQLKLKPSSFMYPLMVDNGIIVRKQLQEQKIYIPVLWPSVFENTKPSDSANYMATNILPLPIDQRYDLRDMKRITEITMACLH